MKGVVGFRIEFDRLVVVGQSAIEIALPALRLAPARIAAPVVGIEPDGDVVICDCAIELALGDEDFRAVVGL